MLRRNPNVLHGLGCAEMARTLSALVHSPLADPSQASASPPPPPKATKQETPTIIYYRLYIIYPILYILYYILYTTAQPSYSMASSSGSSSFSIVGGAESSTSPSPWSTVTSCLFTTEGVPSWGPDYKGILLAPTILGILGVPYFLNPLFNIEKSMRGSPGC